MLFRSFLAKGGSQQQAHFPIRMMLELLPENMLERFAWYPWTPFSADNLLLLYRKQKRMQKIEGISMDRDVVAELQELPDFEKLFEETHSLNLFPDSRNALDYCHLLVKSARKVKHITLEANFDADATDAIPRRELDDSSTRPGLITSTIFSHLQPFSKCVAPLVLRTLSLHKISLRYAAETYCKFIDLRSIKTLVLANCAGVDALLAELCKETKLPDKLETLEVQHNDNAEQDGLHALDGFLSLVTGIQELTIDFAHVQTLPAAAGIIRQGKTLRLLSVHARRVLADRSFQLYYDSGVIYEICGACPDLEQLSLAFEALSVFRESGDFTLTDFEVSAGVKGRAWA